LREFQFHCPGEKPYNENNNIKTRKQTCGIFFQEKAETKIKKFRLERQRQEDCKFEASLDS
jgi:hypothetical protein